MRILQVLATLGTGGAEHCAVELTNELIRQGYKCDIVTLFDVEENNDLVKQLNPQVNFFFSSQEIRFGSTLLCKVVSLY